MRPDEIEQERAVTSDLFLRRELVRCKFYSSAPVTLGCVDQGILVVYHESATHRRRWARTILLLQRGVVRREMAGVRVKFSRKSDTTVGLLSQIGKAPLYIE